MKKWNQEKVKLGLEGRKESSEEAARKVKLRESEEEGFDKSLGDNR